MERYPLVGEIVYLQSDITYKRITPSKAIKKIESLIFRDSHNSNFEVMILVIRTTGGSGARFATNAPDLFSRREELGELHSPTKNSSTSQCGGFRIFSFFSP